MNTWIRMAVLALFTIATMCTAAYSAPQERKPRGGGGGHRAVAEIKLSEDGVLIVAREAGRKGGESGSHRRERS